MEDALRMRESEDAGVGWAVKSPRERSLPRILETAGMGGRGWRTCPVSAAGYTHCPESQTKASELSEGGKGKEHVLAFSPQKENVYLVQRHWALFSPPELL